MCQQKEKEKKYKSEVKEEGKCKKIRKRKEGVRNEKAKKRDCQ